MEAVAICIYCIMLSLVFYRLCLAFSAILNPHVLDPNVSALCSSSHPLIFFFKRSVVFVTHQGCR